MRILFEVAQVQSPEQRQTDVEAELVVDADDFCDDEVHVIEVCI